MKFVRDYLLGALVQAGPGVLLWFRVCFACQCGLLVRVWCTAVVNCSPLLFVFAQMPSNWRSLAEKWGRGEEQRKDVVIEAVLEGQITELVAYLNETDAEDSGKEDTKYAPSFLFMSVNGKVVIVSCKGSAQGCFMIQWKT